MAKYNPFDPANGYSEEDRLALNGKCASLINQAYKNPFPGTKIRLDGADNAGIFFAKQLAHVKTKAYDKDFTELSGLRPAKPMRELRISNTTAMSRLALLMLSPTTPATCPVSM